MNQAINLIWQLVLLGAGLLVLSILTVIIVFVCRGIYEVAKTGKWDA